MTDVPWRQVELTAINEEVSGNLGYTWGRLRCSDTPSSGGEPARDAGRYVAVATRDAPGCWKHQWFLWNIDSSWTKAG